MKKKCLFIYTSKAPFVLNDGKFLHRHFKVTEYHVKPGKSLIQLIWELFKFLKFVRKIVPKTDFVYTWFSDYQSPILTSFAKSYKKPIYRVVGGFEVEHLPHLKYGGLKNPIRKWAITYSLNQATLLLTVSKHTTERTAQLVSHNRIKLIYNGFDFNDFEFDRKYDNKEKKYFVTAGNFITEQYVKRKGIDKLKKLAQYFEYEKFIIIGISEKLESPTLRELPKNVILKPFIPLNELQQYYEQAKFYLQLSELETFGVAVLEALSFGAIPIISQKGALPEIFGDISIIVNTDEMDKEIPILQQKIDTFVRDEEKIFDVINKYNIKNRYKKLAQVLLEKPKSQ